MRAIDICIGAMIMLGLAGLSAKVEAQSAYGSSGVRTCPDSRIRFGQTLCNPGTLRVADPKNALRPFTLIAEATVMTASCQPTAERACPGRAHSNKPLRFIAYAYNSRLAPPVWKVPRDADKLAADLGTIRFRLVNRLPPQRGDDAGKPQPTNIHTHGLIVSPQDAAGPSRRYGDNVFVAICPKIDPRPAGESGNDVCLKPVDRGAAHLRGAHQGHQGHQGHRVEVGSAHYAIAVPSDHPPGLNWFHPHAHGVSAVQVGAGLSGLIAIGDLCSYSLEPAVRAELCQNRDGVSVLRQGIRERFLMLKDLQVAYPDSAEPGTRASAEGYEVATSCLGVPRSFGSGWCEFSRHDAEERQGDAPATQGLWMFTVNGQVGPVIGMAAGGSEVWRIANVSANFTYRLALCKAPPTADPDANDKHWKDADKAYADHTACDRQPFRIVSIDGAGAWNEQFQPLDDELVMMPGSRAEIIVNAPEKDRLYLAHLGFKFPDTWPATILARAERAAPASSLRSPNLMNVTFATSSKAQARVIASGPPHAPHGGGRPEGCTEANTLDGDGTVTVVFGRKQAEDESQKKSEILVLKTWVRTDITRDADFRACADPAQGTNATEGLGSGTPRDQCKPFLGTEFQPERKDLCVRKGSTVKFRLINATSEAHNFHLHQSKFDVTYFDAPASATASPSRGTLRNATMRRISRLLAPGFKQVDSVPVLPVQVEADGTMRHIVELNVSFDRPQQVGDFVFHCHILEHEDKGMMNTIKVFE